MSTPLFIQTPTWGRGATATQGQSLSAYNTGSTVFTDLTGIVTEPTLIEEIAWCAQKFSTKAGQLLVVANDNAGGGGDRRLIGSFALEAGSASKFASNRIKLNVTIPAGFKLEIAHDVKESDNTTYAFLDTVPLGGIVA